MFCEEECTLGRHNRNTSGYTCSPGRLCRRCGWHCSQVELRRALPLLPNKDGTWGKHLGGAPKR